MDNDNLSTSGLVDGNGGNITINVSPETGYWVSYFKQEILKLLKAIPRKRTGEQWKEIYLEDDVDGDLVEYSEIENLIDWIERGTD